jgi:hypothetical protein
MARGSDGSLPVERAMQSQSSGPPQRPLGVPPTAPDGNPPSVGGRLPRAPKGHTIGYGTGLYQPPKGADPKDNMLLTHRDAQDALDEDRRARQTKQASVAQTIQSNLGPQASATMNQEFVHRLTQLGSKATEPKNDIIMHSSGSIPPDPPQGGAAIKRGRTSMGRCQ